MSPEEHRPTEEQERAKESEDLNDMLQELRILLQGAQLLSAFLIVLPFNEGFTKIDDVEKWIYLATFLCALISLILFSAPAAQHRLARPLMDRVRFKVFATRMIVAGMVPLSIALILVTQLVVNEVMGGLTSLVATGVIALVLGLLWWLIPLVRGKQM